MVLARRRTIHGPNTVYTHSFKCVESPHRRTFCIDLHGGMATNNRPGLETRHMGTCHFDRIWLHSSPDKSRLPRIGNYVLDAHERHHQGEVGRILPRQDAIVSFGRGTYISQCMGGQISIDDSVIGHGEVECYRCSSLLSRAERQVKGDCFTQH